MRNFYRFCILPIYLAAVRIISRTQLAVCCQCLTYLTCTKFRLVNKKIKFTRPSKIFIFQTHTNINKLVGKLSDEREKIHTVFNFIRRKKRQAITLPWISAEEAWLLPALDCKAFSILMLELLKALGIKSELWIGINGSQEEGHAWLEVEIKGEKLVIDREHHQFIPTSVYQRTHPYPLSTKIA